MFRALSLLLLAGCATAPPANCPPQPASTSATQSQEEVLGTVNGIAIRSSDLDPDATAELKSIKNESMQREFHIMWLAVDDAIGTALLEQEAKNRGITVDELRSQEIEDKLQMPSDEEIRAIYDANKEVIGVPFETAGPHIKQQLAVEKIRAAEAALIGSLRQSADVRHSLEPPVLPRFDIDVGEAASWGKEDAKVTVVEFSDFECPYCGRASELLNQLKALYPNDLRIVFRDFPLSQHRSAKFAAEAAQCANDQGKFWEYHDLLFANMRELGEGLRELSETELRKLSETELRELVKEKLQDFAKQVGLEEGAFDACFASDRPKKLVAANMQAGRRFGIDGTPAIFINGIKLIGLLPLPMIQALIDHELKTQ